MDGFAIRSEDTASASETNPVTLQIVAEVACGARQSDLSAIGKGEAVRIMTGAPLPPGTDSVVIKEKVEVVTEKTSLSCKLNAPVAHQANVRFAGEDVAQDAVVGDAGTVITPARLSLLASAGYVEVEVHQRPRVVVIASGSELVPIGQKPQPHQIVNSNAHAVASALSASGANVQILGIAEDTLEAHATLLSQTQDADLIVTIGGVSMGEKDWVRPALNKIDAKQIFWKVAMRPGKPLVFARKQSQLFVGLPGNPVSALVGTELFLKPMIRRFLGHKRIYPQPLYATVTNTTSLKKRADFTTFFRAVLSVRQKNLEVTALTKQSSGQISGLAQSNSLLITPVGPATIATGALLPVIPLNFETLLTGSSLQAK